MNHRLNARFVVSACALLFGVGVMDASAGIIDFEDLVVGDRFFDDDEIISNGVPMAVQGFQGGHIDVQNLGMAGGTGNELEFFGGPGGGGSLLFNFGAVIKSLSLQYGAYGGGLNVMVNGETEIVLHNFLDLPETIGGVQVTVLNEPGSPTGMLLFDGVISSFAIGGQEFVLDNVSYQVLPGPGALYALVLMGAGLLTNRRRAVDS